MDSNVLADNLKLKIRNAKKNFINLKKHVHFDKYSPAMMLYLAEWSENSEILKILACHPDQTIKEAIIQNPFTACETLYYFLTFRNKDFIRMVLSYGKLEQEDFFVLAEKFDDSSGKKNEDVSKYLQLIKPTSKGQWANSQSICLLHNHHVGLKAMKNINIRGFEPFTGDGTLKKLLEVKNKRIQEIKDNVNVSQRIAPNDCMNFVQKCNHKKYKVEEWRTKNKVYEMIFDEAENHLLNYNLGAEGKAPSSGKNVQAFIKKEPLTKQQPEELFNSVDTKKLKSWLSKVRRDGNRLSEVPKKFKTYKVCLASVKQEGNALQYVPESIMNKEICFEAIKNNGYSLKFVPLELADFDMYESAVGQCGVALEFVPKKFINKSLCFKAVVSSGWALTYVPDQFVTDKLCHLAVTQNGYTIRTVPIKFLSEELCLAAVQETSSALSSIPETFRTKAVVGESVKKNQHMFGDVPNDLLTEDLIMDVVKNYGGTFACILKKIPNNKQTEKICAAAINEDGRNLELIAKSLQTESICLTAVSKHGQSIKYVSKRFLSESICFAAVKAWPGAIKYVPEKLQSIELCILACREGMPWEVVEYLSETYIIQHPFLLSKVTKDKYPSNSIFEKSMNSWIANNLFNDLDIRACLLNAPSRFKKIQAWRDWEIKFRLTD